MNNKFSSFNTKYNLSIDGYDVKLVDVFPYQSTDWDGQPYWYLWLTYTYKNSDGLHELVSPKVGLPITQKQDSSYGRV